jgi:hypothetical protein
VLRFEAITHNTAELRCGRILERFGEIVTRLAGMAERFTIMLDCVDVGFIPDQFLDQLPARPKSAPPGRRHQPKPAPHPRSTPRRARAGRRPRRVHRQRPRRQGPGDDRAHRLNNPAGRLPPAQAARQTPDRQTRPRPALPRSRAGRPHHRRPTRPARPGHRPDPRRCPQPADGTQPAAWTSVDRDYEQLRVHMQTLFGDLGITTAAAAA